VDRRRFADISNYQARFEAHQYASAGAMLVMVLATDGPEFVSDKHAEQAAHAHEAGLRVWHYHFARPEQDPTAHGEMAHFWGNVKPQFHPGDRLVLDVEKLHPLGIASLVSYVRRLDSTLHHISGVAEACYMPDSLFRQCGPALQIISGDFHIASWGGRVARLGHGRRMVAQQVSNGEEGTPPFRMPGIGRCDTNLLPRWNARWLAGHPGVGHKSR
jgi:hypothetical protein